MARMKCWWVGGGACGVDKELVGGRRCWWVGGGACGMNEELVGFEEVLMGGLWHYRGAGGGNGGVNEELRG